MAVASIKKVEFYVHNSVVEDVLSILQKTGTCEIVSRQDVDEVDSHSTAHLQRIDSLLSETRFLLRFFEPFYEDSVPPMARALGERPDFSVEELASLAEKTDLLQLAEHIRTLERRLIEIRSEITQIDSTKAILSHITELPYSLELVSRGTRFVGGFVGMLPVEQIAGWKQAIEKNLGDAGEFFIASYEEKEKEAWVALFCRRDKEQEALDLCSKYGFSRIEIPDTLTESVGEELLRLETRRESLLKEEEKIETQASSEATKWMPTTRALSDYWNILKSKYEVLSNSEFTDKTVIIKSWIPEVAVPKVEEQLKQYRAVMEIAVSDPSPEDEPPTLLVNKGWVLPFETLTKLYGLPKYGELDPSPLLAPFFFVFFGMCLGDGGYGLIMLGFFLFFMKKFKRMPEGVKNFITLFILSGISTIFVGAFTGSWFGDLIDVFGVFKFIRPIKNIPVVLDPMNDPMTVLFISLGLGTIQIFFGLFVAFYDSLRKKDYMGAFADQGGWILFLLGLLLIGGTVSGKLPASLSMPSKATAAAGALVLVLTQGRAKSGVVQKAISGVMSLYNVTSYLGDVLSYSRLLALGLASAAIGSIINMLASLAMGIPFIGWVLALILIFGGHLFSVAVNVLGAFVHSLRLQYVEFFSKFYSGGGKSFAPLTYNTSFVTISETKEA